MVNIYLRKILDRPSPSTASSIGRLLRTSFGLHQPFECKVISREVDVNWLTRLCDLTPLDFNLSGFLISQVYVNKLKSTADLKGKITNAISPILPDLWAESHEILETSNAQHTYWPMDAIQTNTIFLLKKC